MPLELPSSAGHDSIMPSRLAEIALLFARCGRSISYRPAVVVTTGEWSGVGAHDVLERFPALLTAAAE